MSARGRERRNELTLQHEFQGERKGCKGRRCMVETLTLVSNDSLKRPFHDVNDTPSTETPGKSFSNSLFQSLSVSDTARRERQVQPKMASSLGFKFLAISSIQSLGRSRKLQLYFCFFSKDRASSLGIRLLGDPNS
mmetsp:Transcript_14281/g.36358  ORF Transcript_14281/g.36358 Transcript_14281/m.36358 type:complete len:136 (+) Transcript_14281:1382-1789(+)